MRNLHQSSAMQVLDTTPLSVRLPGIVRFQAARAGWLWVDHGRVWITRDGDSADHVLAAGGALRLARGEQVLAEPWRAGDAAGLRWALAGMAQASAGLPASGLSTPAGAGFGTPTPGVPSQALGGVPRPLAGAAWRVVALGLRAAAGRLAFAARSAEAMASRAQGSMAAGDSIASSGALQ